jgi:hypothetical protein
MTYTNIEGRSRATAEALLAAAEKVGAQAHEVRTSIRGYIVPDAVAAEYHRMVAGNTAPVEEEIVEEEVVEEEKSSFPDEGWKNDDIKAWAESHEVDLGNATKKADMLAAIQAADTKEE